MTAQMLLDLVTRAGGKLTVVGDHLDCELPREAEHLVDDLRVHKAELLDLLAIRKLNTMVDDQIMDAPAGCPTLPAGVRLVAYRPKTAPVAIDVCTLVVNVERFMLAELRDLNSRLNHPWTIRGGFTVPQILDRLAQAGLEVELDLKGGR
jgi:hypothetical protein